MQENKTVLFTREHKTLYAQGDKVIKVFDSNYKKSVSSTRRAMRRWYRKTAT